MTKWTYLYLDAYGKPIHRDASVMDAAAAEHWRRSYRQHDGLVVDLPNLFIRVLSVHKGRYQVFISEELVE